MADFESGTITVFQQTSAPTGWTKLTAHDNCGVRVVSGSAGTGGTTNFTSVMTNRTWQGTVSSSGASSVGATTLTTAQLPSHSHQFRMEISTPAAASDPASGYAQTIGSSVPAGGTTTARASAVTATAGTSGAAGGGGSHSHTVGLSFSFTGGSTDFSINYVDIILASKN